MKLGRSSQRVLIGLLALLSVAGVMALARMAMLGAEPRWRWGYIAALRSFLVSACQLAPVLSMSSRVGRGYWGAPLRRVADLLGFVGVITAPLLIVLLLQLPEWRGRPSIWFDWPGAPGAYDAAAGIGLAACGWLWLRWRPGRNTAGATGPAHPSSGEFSRGR